MMRRVVVLPQPEGPSKVMNSPRRTVRCTSRRIALAPKDFETGPISRSISSVKALYDNPEKRGSDDGLALAGLVARAGQHGQARPLRVARIALGEPALDVGGAPGAGDPARVAAVAAEARGRRLAH